MNIMLRTYIGTQGGIKLRDTESFPMIPRDQTSPITSRRRCSDSSA
jgi:hypothetical protein